MLPCPDDDLLDQLLARELDDPEQEAFDAHVDGCPHCQARLKKRAADDRGLSHLLLPYPESADGAAVAAAEPTADALRRFGIGDRYKLGEEVARGGMGVVYRCRDTRPDRELAVKVLQERFRDHPSVIERFHREADLLGQLQHPNIPPIHELGRFPDGRPYFTMKLVEGRTLAALLSERTDLASSLPRVLGYFVQVCRTLAYAHAHAQRVIHRDLKPLNIMVGAFDEVQVMDWGLAKPLWRKPPNPEGEAALLETDNGVELTQVQPGNPMGTLPYMSPEQVEGREEVGPASDVYSLGATLYTILTGRAPFEGGDKKAMQERVRRGEFPRPRQLDWKVPAALEAICLKAMALQSEERYESASALAADVAAWLAKEPVRAWNEPWNVRAQRWVERHRTLVTSAVVGLVISVLLLSVGIVVANRAFAREKQLREETDTAFDLLVEIFRSPDPEVSGKDIKVVELLHGAHEQVERNLAIPPASKSKLLESLGRTYLGLGLHEEAIPLLEQVLSERQIRLGNNHQDSLAAKNHLGRAYLEAGKHGEAKIHLKDSLRLCRAQLGPEHPETLLAMEHLGGVYWKQGRLDDAIQLAEDTYKIREARLGSSHALTLRSRNNLGVFHWEAGRLREALPFWKEGLELGRASLGLSHPDVFTFLDNLGAAYTKLGENQEALRFLQEAFDHRKTRLGEDHPATLTSRNNLGAFLVQIGQYDAALPFLRETLKLHLAKLGPNHPQTLVVMNNLGNAYQASGRPLHALPILLETLKLRKANLDASHPETLLTMSNLGVAYQKAGSLVDALPLLKESLRGLQLNPGRGHPDTIKALSNLAVAYQVAGRPQDALPLLGEVLRDFEAKLGPNHADTLLAMRNLGIAYRESKRFQDAETIFEDLLQRCRHRAMVDPNVAADVQVELAASLLGQEKYAQAEPLLRACLAEASEKRPTLWARWNIQSLLGVSLAGQKKFPEAEKLLVESYAGMERSDKHSPEVKRTCLMDLADNLIRFYEDWGNPEKAQEWRSKRESVVAHGK